MLRADATAPDTRDGAAADELSVLVLEDRPTDAELMVLQLERSGFQVAWQRVDTEEAYLSALAPGLDLILADYSLPQFDALRALRALQKKALPIPFIMVTGVLRDEDVARCLREGAADFLQKDRLGRLGDAVRQAIEWQRAKELKRRADAALQDSEERFRALFEQAAVGISVASPAGVFVQANDAMCSIVGYEREELLALTPVDITDGDDVAADQELMVKLLNREIPAGEVEKRYVHRDGSYVWVRSTSSLVWGADGSPLYFLSVAQDVTARRRAMDALRRSEARFRALADQLTDAQEEERARLARDLHDWAGQNLTALGLGLEVVRSLLRRGESDRIPAQLDQCLDVVEELGQHVRDVMTDLRPTVIDEYGLPAALEWYGAQFRDRTGIAVERDVRPSARGADSRTEIALYRVAQEALTNVGRHSQADRCRLLLTRDGATVRLAVDDTGVGFDVDGRQVAEPSRGWGLVNMRERMRAVGGALRVESRPGEGTTILARAPAAQD